MSIHVWLKLSLRNNEGAVGRNLPSFSSIGVSTMLRDLSGWGGREVNLGIKMCSLGVYR